MSQDDSIRILNGQMSAVEFDNVQFKFIASFAVIENITHLIFIQADSKKVFVYAATPGNEKVQKQFLQNWK